jgi:hypothetical protein
VEYLESAIATGIVLIDEIDRNPIFIVAVVKDIIIPIHLPTSQEQSAGLIGVPIATRRTVITDSDGKLTTLQNGNSFIGSLCQQDWRLGWHRQHLQTQRNLLSTLLYDSFNVLLVWNRNGLINPRCI